MNHRIIKNFDDKMKFLIGVLFVRDWGGTLCASKKPITQNSRFEVIISHSKNFVLHALFTTAAHNIE